MPNSHHHDQVISGSKFIMKESTHDHVDLLWPLAYAVDMACDDVAHMKVTVPKSNVGRHEDYLLSILFTQYM